MHRKCTSGLFYNQFLLEITNLIVLKKFETVIIGVMGLTLSEKVDIFC